MWLSELQVEDIHTQKIQAESGDKQSLKKGWKDVDRVLYQEGLLYIPEIVRTKLISRHHDDPLAGHFEINKMQELIAQKYYLLTPKSNIETDVKGCDVCLTSKAVKYRFYCNL